MDLNTQSSKIYLNKIVSSSIIEILSKENRLRVDKNLVDEKIKTEFIAALANNTSIETGKKVNKYKDVDIKYDFEYSPAIPITSIKSEILQGIYDSVVVENSQAPEKEYLQIYTLRYIKKYPLTKIAKKLNMPEKNVSKTLFELMEKVRKTLN